MHITAGAFEQLQWMLDLLEPEPPEHRLPATAASLELAGAEHVVL